MSGSITYQISYWRDRSPSRFFHFFLTRAGRVIASSPISYSEHKKARSAAYELLCESVAHYRDRARFRVEESEHIIQEGTRDFSRFIINPLHSNLLPSPREPRELIVPLNLSEL